MDLIGKVLRDRYEIEELIGSGGMARVYKAKCRQLNRYVAIKVLREELKDDKEFVDKFKTLNAGDPKLCKYIEGIHILRPALIFAAIYYGILPMFSTYTAEKVDKFIEKRYGK